MRQLLHDVLMLGLLCTESIAAIVLAANTTPGTVPVLVLSAILMAQVIAIRRVNPKRKARR